MWGIDAPAHAELDPSAADPVIAPLACGLVEQSGTIRFEPGSRLRAIYGCDDAVEGYHFNYGLNPACEGLFATGPLRVPGSLVKVDVLAADGGSRPARLALMRLDRSWDPSSTSTSSPGAHPE